MKPSQKHKVLMLNGPVNVNMFQTLVARTPSLGKCPQIILNSEGGDVYQGNAIYDWIKLQIDNAQIIGCGLVMSTAVMILQSAAYRMCLPNTQFLIHYGHDSSSSISERKHNGELLDIYVDSLVENSHLTRRKVLSFMDKETYFNAETALRYGLIDEIIGDWE